MSHCASLGSVMANRTIHVILILLLAVLASALSAADPVMEAVHMKDGRVLEGVVEAIPGDSRVRVHIYMKGRRMGAVTVDPRDITRRAPLKVDKKPDESERGDDEKRLSKVESWLRFSESELREAVAELEALPFTIEQAKLEITDLTFKHNLEVDEYNRNRSSLSDNEQRRAKRSVERMRDRLDKKRLALRKLQGERVEELNQAIHKYTSRIMELREEIQLLKADVASANAGPDEVASAAGVKSIDDDGADLLATAQSSSSANPLNFTVYISCRFSFGSGSGSGFVVSPNGLVVTNAHVVKDPRARATAERITVMWDLGQGRKSQEYTIKDIDTDLDLALLAPVAPTTYSAATFDLSPVPGEDIKLYGFPLANMVATGTGTVENNIVVTRGGISSLRRDSNGTLRKLQLDIRASPGNSGGPVVNSDGQVLGVLTSGFTTGVSSQIMAIPVRVVAGRFSAHLRP
jgi:S1-C subfamily serine protease